MKKLSLLISFALCTIFLLSSCSRFENISVTKRHYRSGYYVDLGSKQKEVSAQSNINTVTPIVKTEVNPGSVSSDLDIIGDRTFKSLDKVSPPNTTKNISRQKEKKEHSAKTTTGNFFAGSQTIAAIKGVLKAEKLKKQMNAITDVNTVGQSSSSDTPMWLMIVFCVLLPPLAVGLKFGIEKEFWISLLLTLLFWIPGVIYALIKVT